jgi:hypothetical protein
MVNRLKAVPDESHYMHANLKIRRQAQPRRYLNIVERRKLYAFIQQPDI